MTESEDSEPCPYIIYFNPLPPHGGRLQLANTIVQITIFQSTPSAWRETVDFLELDVTLFISIHSLRMEGDVA